ncbi:Fucose 4-O-acetylase [Lachnospiraceae bacterium]|nr:Fucose 4-O-acetylase [Lachnospiraceae bacterium]
MSSRQRDFRMDNIKAILILLVVIGHLMELYLKTGTVKTVYKIIYSFHMPLFIFISGYFARFRIKKMIIGLLAPYFVFQTAYILFLNLILHEPTRLQYTKPYWILWYLMAMFIWCLTIPLIDRGGHIVHAAFFILSAAGAIGIGYVRKIGMNFTLSRVFVYYPFFLLGFYIAKLMKDEDAKTRIIAFYHRYFYAILIAAGASFGAVMGYIIRFMQKYSYVWFYECAPYAVTHETPFARLLHLLIASICIIFIFLLVPNIRLRLFTKLGSKTKPVYLFHGFVILALKNAAGLI